MRSLVFRECTLAEKEMANRALFDQSPSKPVRVAIVVSRLFQFRHLDATVRLLCKLGHEVDIVHPEEPDSIFGDVLRKCLAETPGAKAWPLVVPKNRGWSWLLWPLRELLNYSLYFKPEHPSRWLAGRWQPYLPPVLQSVVRNPIWRMLLVSRPCRALMRLMEAAIPIDPGIARWLQWRRPDVVLASPWLLRHAIEVEYARAAKSLGIPTAAAVGSWDNFTTKGTFHAIPDATFVWNKPLLHEASMLHGVPKERIIITGSPNLERLFEMQPDARDAFCRQVGMSPQQPYFIYICSYDFVIANEAPFVVELARRMRSHPDLQQASLVVRPYPDPTGIWQGFKAERVFLWPPVGEFPTTSQSWQTYYNSIFHAHAMIGINTTGFLDAACLNKPCITILDDRNRDRQLSLGHFHHLLRAGFLQVANSAAESTDMLAAILHGSDPKSTDRARFVKEFIRPLGPRLGASEATAYALQQLALGNSPREIADILVQFARNEIE
jgi:hypothetical protein